MQEAFVKSYAALGRFRDGHAFRPWLLRIVANETRNLHRSAGRRAAREQRAWEQVAPLLASDDPAVAMLGSERRAELVRGLGALSAQHREVLTCRYLLELDEAETATVLGWPRGTVKSRLHRALRALEAAMASRDRVDDRERCGAVADSLDGLVAVSVDVAVLLGALAAPPVRATIADWFDFAAVRVHLDDDAPDSGAG